MNKLLIFNFALTGSLTAFADLPIFFLFGVVFAGILIELKKIEKKAYPIISNIFMSSIIGWATSFAVKKYLPDWFNGDIKIFSMLMTTVFAYISVLYVIKNETIQKLIERIINSKFKNDERNNN